MRQKQNQDQENDKYLEFQPLANIDDEAEKIWAAEWLLGLLINEEIIINPEASGEKKGFTDSQGKCEFDFFPIEPYKLKIFHEIHRDDITEKVFNNFTRSSNIKLVEKIVSSDSTLGYLFLGEKLDVLRSIVFLDLLQQADKFVVGKGIKHLTLLDLGQ